MTPLSIAITIILGIALFALPRKWAVFPFIFCLCLVPAGPAIKIGPAYFTIYRLLITCGFIRVLSRGEFQFNRNSIDTIFIFWAILMVVTGTILNKDLAGFINRAGTAFDALGIYLMFRLLLRDHTDALFVIKVFAVLFAILAIEMMFEKATGRNLFSLFGGISETVLVRKGKFRCQGPFMHPILTGTAAAMTTGLISILWFWDQKSKKYAIIGWVACLAVVLLTTSSGPIMSLIQFMAALACWRFRNKMKMVQWTIIGGLIIAQLSMKAPVWFLLSKVNLTGSSDGWHRSQLISSTIDHFSEWWLVGTNYTRHWMPTGVEWSPNHTDITNFYIKQGVLGGFFLMVAFILVIARSFKAVGFVIKNSVNMPLREQLFVWVLGSILFSHTITFLSVSYFDETSMYFYLNIALISLMYDLSLNENDTSEETVTTDIPLSEPA